MNIYGPEYTLRENIERLRNRGLSTKRSLALREFALGVEGLRRFVEGEPLYRVHECAFAVLALESEPLTPGYESQRGEWAAKTLYGHRKGKRHNPRDSDRNDQLASRLA